MTIFFRDYLAERLKDEVFRKEYEAVAKEEATKAKIKRGKRTKKLSKNITNLPPQRKILSGSKRQTEASILRKQRTVLNQN